MKRLLAILLLLSCCTSCTALPAEERAFAVVLCVEKDGAEWRVQGRIPTYQSGGGYLTIAGEGETLPAALADMETAAPMHVHLSQLRLLVLAHSVADAGELSSVLTAFSERADMRQQCAIAMTEAPVDALMEAFEPVTGARLSKSIDVLLDSRIERGMILPATLADIACMGERQTPVLIGLTFQAGRLELSGGYPLTDTDHAGDRLTPEEIGLLSLLMRQAKTLRLSFSDTNAEVRDVSARLYLSEDVQTASICLTLRATMSSIPPEELEQRLAEACLHLLSRLSAQGCDVLGLGRKAVLRTHDVAAWHALDWPAVVRQLRWRVTVGVTGPT